MKFFQLIILSLTLSLVIILSVGLFFAFDYPWHQKEFLKLDIYQKIAPVRVASQTFNLFSYFNNREKLLESYYTDRERLHLADVKNLINWAKIINWLLIAGLTAQLWWLTKSAKNFFGLLKDLFFVSLLSLIFYIIIITLLYFNFYQIFVGFHQIFFSNDYWQLDPNTESLIVIFPPELFFTLVKRIVNSSLLILIILCIALSLLKKLVRTGGLGAKNEPHIKPQND